MLKNIDRREFISGIAVSLAAVGTMPLRAVQDGLAAPGEHEWQYPPAKTGMRGSHPGSFEVAHEIAWSGRKFDRPDEAKDKPYDLVVVGAGISGLATALMARDRLGDNARILILDNHDDFGGHAKRNEFTVNGKTVIGYGGSQSIDTPSAYSEDAKAFLKSLTIDTERFYRFFDRSFYKRRGMSNGLYLDADGFGEDRFLRRNTKGDYGTPWAWESDDDKADLVTFIKELPLSLEDKEIFRRVFVEREDWLTGKTRAEKIKYLQSHSFEACLRDSASFSDEMLNLLRNDQQTFWGISWGALSGLEAVRMGHPATYGLGIDTFELEDSYGDEPYIFHFPDGNASIARLAVAKLIPDAVEGSDMDTIVKARVHYDRLDLPRNKTRIRLSSTVVEAKNTDDGVDITYVRDGKVERVEARYAVMACWHSILPHIMPEMESEQRQAIAYAEKTPLTYVNVALTNWRAFDKAKVSSIFAPGSLLAHASLDFPVNMGGYLFARTPDDPIVLHMVHVPNVYGLPPRDQFRKGRHRMLQLGFEDYEQAIVNQLSGALGSYGFDAEKDIAAITVNRWPHGYAYEYNELFDDPSWGADNGPHVTGRQTNGNIALANSDASAHAYVDGAIDAAVRALDSLL